MRWLLAAVALAALGGVLGGIYDLPTLLVAGWDNPGGEVPLDDPALKRVEEKHRRTCDQCMRSDLGEPCAAVGLARPLVYVCEIYDVKCRHPPGGDEFCAACRVKRTMREVAGE